VASFIHEDPFGPGAYWAIAKLAPIAPEAFEDRVDDLLLAVGSDDPVVRGYSLLALAQLRPRAAQKLAAPLQQDQAEIWGYDDERGEPISLTVASLALQVLDSESAAA
jgi:hypothetical protein